MLPAAADLYDDNRLFRIMTTDPGDYRAESIMPIIPTGYVSVDQLIQFQGDPEMMEVTYWLLVSEAASADMAGDLDQAFWDEVGSGLTNDVVSGGVRLQDSEGGIIELPPTGRAGVGTGQPYPPNTAVLFRKRSGIAGRSNQGRLFVPGFSNDQDTGNGVIGVSELVALQAIADGWLDAVEAVDGVDSMVIAHGDIDEAPGPTPTVVTNLVVANRLATQRQRLRP